MFFCRTPPRTLAKSHFSFCDAAIAAGGDGYSFFVFNDTATTEIYTLSLHDALPISVDASGVAAGTVFEVFVTASDGALTTRTRSEEHTSELQSCRDLVCRLLLE